MCKRVCLIVATFLAGALFITCAPQSSDPASAVLGLEQGVAPPQTDGQAAPAPSDDAANAKRGRLRGTTSADREAAAARAAAARLAGGGHDGGPRTPGGTPDYFGIYPNYANSPAPTVNPDGTVTGGMHKFVDGLPGLGGPGTPTLGQYIPVATAGVFPGYPNDDYYEIALVQYREQMHSDLPQVVRAKTDPLATGGTLLRGYVQEVNGVPVDLPHYLGPLIIAQKGKAVRVKFTNRLPIDAAGDLFIPVDTSVMGAGMGPDGMNMYKQNRGTLHLHGGNTPWISDGTPHQWTVPAAQTTRYKKGGQHDQRPRHVLRSDHA